MTDFDNLESVPEDTGEVIDIDHVKGRKAFSRLRRELTDDELSSPAVQRMLIDDIERLEKDNAELEKFRNRYYEADKNCGILNEKLKVNICQDVIFGTCLTIGSALISLYPSLHIDKSNYANTLLIMGFILIAGGIASKVVKK